MKKLFVITCLLVAVSGQLQAQTCALPWLTARLSARESAGYNRGPLVDAIVRAGGGAPGQEWCGFTQAAANRSCGQPIPRAGLQGTARNWFPLAGPDAGRTVFHRAAGRGRLDAIAVGQKAGYDFGRGLHHVNAVAELGRPLRAGRAPRAVWCLGGNEGTGATAVYASLNRRPVVSREKRIFTT
ncbi:hypothetical protein Q5H92_26505 [Hymenobacter sp. M29]|uniref:Uncharacterized protein n=1 Tax=Hymenobacter mellowenesis TaxID=3063995 RepID=A0ABT9AJB5_9BACT|nr:hypothetical protein [Hymenobacter sp. M29]MDO7849939.1 hypothetical protein [Hymenobacter sp. M29]